MKGNMTFDDDLHKIWRERVDSRYLFRGMSAKDLRDPLDPSYDPFDGMRPEIHHLIDILQGLVDHGFQFTLREEHFGEVCYHDLKNILIWTSQDLIHQGVDFTSIHEDARGYSDCFQGSQLKQNFKYITDHLPEHRADPVLQSHISAEEWSLVAEINQWVTRISPEHHRVVLWVKRSCLALEMIGQYTASRTYGQCLPIGSFGSFREHIVETLDKQGLSHTRQSVYTLLPDETEGFSYRLIRPLSLSHVENVEEVVE